MTKRKFPPPTEFPAEYVDGRGRKITLLARGNGQYPLVGQDEAGSGATYRENGVWGPDDSPRDLHDIPKKQVHWANDYDGCIKAWWISREEADAGLGAVSRIAVIRREWVEGELPKYFVEETFDE